MRKARFRVMAGLAGAALCLFAITSYAQNTSTQTGTGAATTPTATDAATPQATTTTDAAASTRSTATDVTTTSTTWSFPGGTLGIIAAAVLVLLVLFALFRGKDRTVIRETSVSSSSSPGPRNASTGTTSDDRTNVNARAASGPGTSSGGMNDPNARR